MTCLECESGRCVCGGAPNCADCLGTGECAECLGSNWGPTLEYIKARRLIASKSYVGCPVCLRDRKPLPGPPRIPVPASARSMGTYTRNMKADRCLGCHHSYADAQQRPNTYRLLEAS